VNAVPEKGRDTTGQGRAIGPDRTDQLGEVGSCVSPFSRHRQIGFARSLSVQYSPQKACERRFQQMLQPPGGRASGERSEPVCPQARGTGPRAAGPYEGGPTGTTDLPGGAVRWALDAAVCGALGCVETEGLVRVEQGGETRVLCLDHARRWSP